MIFAEKTLQDFIVPAIAESGYLTPNEIHDVVVERYGPCSPQAIYKSLSYLMKKGVVIKSHGTYSLNLNWCHEFTKMAQLVEKGSMSETMMVKDLPLGSRPKVRRFNDLIRLYNYWCHVFTGLACTTESRILYSYNPHAWFLLMDSKQGSSCIDTLDKIGCHMQKVVGGQTFLDHWGTKFWQKQNVSYCFDSTGKFEGNKEWLNVIGDYVVRVTLDADTWSMLDKIYGEISSEDGLGANLIESFIGMEVDSILEIELNAEKAALLKKRFDKAFIATDTPLLHT